MMPEIVLEKNKRRTLGFSVGLFLLAVYLFTYRGGFHSIDEVSIFAVTESLVKFGRFNTDQIAWTQWTTSQAEAQGFFGQDGHVYSKKGLALSLAQAPLYWLALYLPDVGMLQTVSLLNAFITAATGLLISMFLERLSFSTITAVIVSLTFGLATIAFVYAKYLFSEPLAGLLLLLAAYMLFTYRQEGGLRHVAIAGLAAGLAVLTRANNLFLLPIFGLYLLWILYEEARRRHETGDDADRLRLLASSRHRIILAPTGYVCVDNCLHWGDADGLQCTSFRQSAANWLRFNALFAQYPAGSLQTFAQPFAWFLYLFTRAPTQLARLVAPPQSLPRRSLAFGRFDRSHRWPLLRLVLRRRSLLGQSLPRTYRSFLRHLPGPAS